MAARGLGRVRRLAIYLPVMPVYAALDELTQQFVNRHASFYDWQADMLGAAVGLIACEVLLGMVGRPQQTQRP